MGDAGLILVIVAATIGLVLLIVVPMAYLGWRYRFGQGINAGNRRRFIRWCFAMSVVCLVLAAVTIWSGPRFPLGAIGVAFSGLSFLATGLTQKRIANKEAAATPK